MIKLSNIQVYNFQGAFRGMRNPLASWHLADTTYNSDGSIDTWGENDKQLALKLVKAGSDHSKFLRQIFVSMDIIAPDYWWKEMDTYKVGTVANSTSTMHKLTSRYLTPEDFSWDELTYTREVTLKNINLLIDTYKSALEPGREDKVIADICWRRLIQDLPMSFNYTRTWTGSYENLRNIYPSRKHHKVIEWHEFCRMIEGLPCSELITVKRG